MILLLVLILVALGVYMCCSNAKSRVFGKREREHTETTQHKRPASIAEVRQSKTMTPAERQDMIYNEELKEQYRMHQKLLEQAETARVARNKLF